MYSSLFFGPLATANSDGGDGAAVIGFLLILGVLCAIFNALGKKKTYDIRGEIRER